VKEKEYKILKYYCFDSSLLSENARIICLHSSPQTTLANFQITDSLHLHQKHENYTSWEKETFIDLTTALLITSSKHILASSNPAISGTGRDSSSFHTDYKGLQMDKPIRYLEVRT